MLYVAAKKGLQSNSYRTRAMILSKICEVRESRCGVDLICRLYIADGLCYKLFTDEPSFTEIVTCSAGCQKRFIPLRRIQIDGKFVKSKIILEEAIERSLLLERRGCANSECLFDTFRDVVIQPGIICL